MKQSKLRHLEEDWVEGYQVLLKVGLTNKEEHWVEVLVSVGVVLDKICILVFSVLCAFLKKRDARTVRNLGLKKPYTKKLIEELKTVKTQAIGYKFLFSSFHSIEPVPLRIW